MASAPTRALATFLRARGATVHPNLELFGERPGGERGAFALKPIAAGETLLSLPRSALIDACEEGATTATWMPAEVVKLDLPPMLRVALVLMRERLLAEAADYPETAIAPEAATAHTAAAAAGTAWGPYVRTLPHAPFDTPEFWSAAELHHLRGTSVHAELSPRLDPRGRLRCDAMTLWTRSLAPLVAAQPEVRVTRGRDTVAPRRALDARARHQYD